jgi:hypothetical protein
MNFLDFTIKGRQQKIIHKVFIKFCLKQISSIIKALEVEEIREAV